MRTEEDNIEGAPSGDAVDAADDVELTEGTDIAAGLAGRSDATKVAEALQRPTSPETEFIAQYYSGTAVDPDALLGWNDVPRVAPPVEGTVRTPRQRLVRRLSFAAVVFGLSAVIALSLWEISRMNAGELPAVSESPAEKETKEEGPPPESRSPAATGPTLTAELPDRGEAAESLLAAVVQEVTPDGETPDVRIGRDVVARRKVTLVNLWATYCKPCTNELPGLKRMFEKAGWGDAVRFVPIQVSDPRDAVWTRQEYIERMPATEHFLSDSAGVVVEALHKLKSAPEKIDLPATVLLDCRRRVRRLHVGALQEPDFESLKKLLDQLRDELDSSYCKNAKEKPPRAPAPAESPGKPPPLIRPAVCGNNSCEPGETATSCCDCRTCRTGERCEQQKSHSVCVLPITRLKDE